jgi:predicted Rossmann fold flavoprotein
MSAKGGSALGGKKITDEQFDVAVIGAGPAGMMAAIRAAQKGARVAILDKKERPGVKLLMAGNGRCNLTQAENNILELSQKYGRNGRFLLSCLALFRPKAVMEFFTDNNLPVKIEKNGKVFPVSDQSQDVLEMLRDLMKENGVTFLYASDIVDFEIEKNKIVKINLKKREITAKNYIIATGGKSFPDTGSTGDGYAWLEKMGHTIVEPKPILTPIIVIEEWIKEMQGISISSVAMSVYINNKKKISQAGDLMFAHFGLSGPLALDMSREIQKLRKNNDNIKISIDFKPYLNFEQLDKTVCRDFEKNGNIKTANCLQSLLPPKLLSFLLKRSGLDLEKYVSRISRQERQKLIALFKGLTMNMTELAGFEKAMVTSGGVSIREIDSKTMRSKIVENLFLAGEIIDVDGPTGGYNLQLCWSTGYVAGENAATNL